MGLGALELILAAGIVGTVFGWGPLKRLAERPGLNCRTVVVAGESAAEERVIKQCETRPPASPWLLAALLPIPLQIVRVWRRDGDD